jgi:hypothetical protein
MTCINCNIDVNETYRVNQLGELFCSDNCYEEYTTENLSASIDHNHPYIDIYENIRSTYINWLQNWEEDLQSSYPDNPLLKADDINDKIDEILYKHNDFYNTEGNDGIFAHEIYSYLLKLEKLQRDILNWRPERETYYYLSIASLSENAEINITNWFEFSKYLYEIKAVNLFILLKDNVHPYDELAFYFESESHLDEVLQEIEVVFGKDSKEDIYFDEAYICEGECHDYEVISDISIETQNGWCFCYSCEEQFYPGFFSKEELLQEINQNNEADIQLKYSKTTYWHFYIRKVKRSCRYLDIGFPDWIDFEYEF